MRLGQAVRLFRRRSRAGNHSMMDVIRTVAFVIAASGAFGAALCLCGLVSNRLDLATHAAPFWLTCGLSALILQSVAGAPTGQPVLGLGTFATLVSVGLVTAELVARFFVCAAPPEDQTLKIIQFNVWDRNRDPIATARWISTEDADIVILEEAGCRAAPIISALSAQYAYRTTSTEAELCPTSILSKLPQTAGGCITPTGLDPRHATAWATFGNGASAFSVAGTHYVWPEPIGPQHRQAHEFAEIIARFDQASLIVAGDFNLTPWSFNLRRQDSAFGLKRLTRALPSWPVGEIAHWGVTFPFPFLPIDHIYAGDAWRTVSVTRGPCLGSDHAPIVAVLTRSLRP